jgi:hypothetical protein
MGVPALNGQRNTAELLVVVDPCLKVTLAVLAGDNR